MEFKTKYLYVICTILLSSFGFSQQQKVEPFLFEAVKQFPNVRDVAISSNGNEILFTAQSVMGSLSTIIYLKKKGNKWDTIQIAPFSGKYFDLEPSFSHDGLQIYFVSNRPLSSEMNTPKNFDIWYVERSSLNAKWSEPKNIGTPINTAFDEFYPSVAKNGNLYFTRDNTTLKRKDDIYVSLYDNGTHSEPILLSESINSDGYEYNAFVAPDEAYLIFGCYNRADGLGSGDLYISYNINNQWTKAKNMGNLVNSDKMDYCPYVDTKTQTLYFTSKRDHTKTQFDKPLKTEELLSELHKYDNGSSRLYKINIGSLLKI